MTAGRREEITAIAATTGIRREAITTIAATTTTAVLTKMAAARADQCPETAAGIVATA
jgi:hypothetical protein